MENVSMPPRVKDQPGNLLDNAINANIVMGVGQLKASEPILAKFVKEGKLKVVGANYELDSGIVRIVG